MSVSNSIIRSGVSVSDLQGVPWCLENSLLTFKFCGFQNSFYTLLWGNTGFQTRCMCWILLSKKYIQIQSTSTAPVRLLPACEDHSWDVVQWIQIYSSFWAGFAWDDPAGRQTLSIPVWEARTAQWHQPAGPWTCLCGDGEDGGAGAAQTFSWPSTGLLEPWEQRGRCRFICLFNACELQFI